MTDIIIRMYEDSTIEDKILIIFKHGEWSKPLLVISKYEFDKLIEKYQEQYKDE